MPVPVHTARSHRTTNATTTIFYGYGHATLRWCVLHTARIGGCIRSLRTKRPYKTATCARLPLLQRHLKADCFQIERDSTSTNHRVGSCEQKAQCICSKRTARRYLAHCKIIVFPLFSSPSVLSSPFVCHLVYSFVLLTFFCNHWTDYEENRVYAFHSKVLCAGKLCRCMVFEERMIRTEKKPANRAANDEVK